jgi:hypothetical protein
VQPKLHGPDARKPESQMLSSRDPSLLNWLRRRVKDDIIGARLREDAALSAGDFRLIEPEARSVSVTPPSWMERHWGEEGK